MLKVVAEEGVIKAWVETIFAPLVPVCKDLIVVIADQLNEELIAEIGEIKERPMLICSIAMDRQLAEWNFLGKLLAEEGVCYATLPFRISEAISLANEVWQGRPAQKTPEILAYVAEAKRNRIEALLRDMHPGKSAYAVEQAVRNAEKDFGFTGSADEVRMQLEALRDSMKESAISSVSNGGVIPGVFCDVDGTLLMGDELISGSLERLQKIAGKRMIMLWTGGDLEKAKQRLMAVGIGYALMAKYDFAGCTVEVAIDDAPAAEIERVYGIKAEEFIRVPLPE